MKEKELFISAYRLFYNASIEEAEHDYAVKSADSINSIITDYKAYMFRHFGRIII